MSTISTAFSAITRGSCAEIVIDVTETLLSTSNLGQPKGFLAAVTSPENKGSFELALNPNQDRPTSGSHTKVYTTDTIPLCDQDTTADGACAVPSYSADDVAAKFKAVEHRIDESIQRKIVLDVEEFQKFCISPEDYIRKRLLAMRDGVQQEVNSKLVPKAIAYAGAYSNGVSSVDPSQNVTFIKANSAGGYMFDPTGYAKILDEYAKIGSPYVSPFIVGGSHVGTLQTLGGFMGGSNVNGVNSTAIPNLYLDYTVDTTLADGNNNLVTWKPGTIQAVGTNAVSDAMIRLSVPNKVEKMRVPDPFGTGLGDWDFYFYANETACIYELRWEKYFDLIVPTPFGVCANKPILNFTVDCEGNECPDSGSGA